MAFLEVLADDQSIYVITGDGSLLWYRDDLRDGTNGPLGERGWAAASGGPIGTGWDGFTDVVAGGDGVIYGIQETGELVWYRDDQRDGQPGWAAGSAAQIAQGWGNFSRVFSGGGGVLYAVRRTGELLWYRDDLADGTNGPNGERGWAAGSGSQIGTGWDAFSNVFSGGDGVIYAVENGQLLWYRDDLRDGTNGPNAERGWAPGSGSAIGQGWDGFQAVFAPGASDGNIYAITATSDLLWYRDDARDGTNGAEAAEGWAPGSGSPIGIGWSIDVPAPIAGYATPLSVKPGDTVDIKLSARVRTSCTVKIFRLHENGDGSVGLQVGDAGTVVVTRQPIPADVWQVGCGWPTSVSVVVNATWPSGLYSARVTTQDGASTVDVVFVVRPGAAKRDFLLLANTNSWNAYNAWGGASNYTRIVDSITLSFDRPNPETAPSALQDAGSYAPNHLTAAEIWVSTWLEAAGYRFDTCSDRDFHLGDPDPTTYKAIILSTHPEYWSLEMAQRLTAYIAGGGKLLYWGGNGIFRQVVYSDDGLSMTTGSSTVAYCGNVWTNGPKPRTLLGVAYDIGHDNLYPQRCGYVVEAPHHRFFAGTDAVQGDVIGTQGRNGGGACGWEADTAVDFGEGNGPAPVNGEILAHGELVTADGYTGHMTYHENDAGGFVFAIGSITFGGSLRIDAKLQQIARNALNSCLA